MKTPTQVEYYHIYHDMINTYLRKVIDAYLYDNFLRIIKLEDFKVIPTHIKDPFAYPDECRFEIVHLKETFNISFQSYYQLPSCRHDCDKMEWEVNNKLSEIINTIDHDWRTDEVWTLEHASLHKMTTDHVYLIRNGYESFGELEKHKDSHQINRFIEVQNKHMEYVQKYGFFNNTVGQINTGSTTSVDEHQQNKFLYRRAYIKKDLI